MTTQTTTSEQGQHGRQGLRSVLGMTVVSAVLLASAAVSLSRRGTPTTVPTTLDTSTTIERVRPEERTAHGGLVEQAPQSDQERYQQWHGRSALGSRPENDNLASDEEMYSRLHPLTGRGTADGAAVSDQEMYQKLHTTLR